MRNHLILFIFLSFFGVANTHASQSVLLEEMTWVEVRDAIKAGKTTVIFPTGGTEQNGPHMVLGKHNYIVKHTAEEIAKRLGNALVAPVLPYTPEGNIDPPSGHMLFPGSISLPEDAFEKVAEYAARSFRTNGFKDIVLIGDSGPNQQPLRKVAARLGKAWAGTGVRVHYAGDYYHTKAFENWLKQQGETARDIGTHAGIEDTSELMAIYPQHIRADKLVSGAKDAKSGVAGNPSRATAAYGKQGLELRISAGVAQIRALIADR